MPTASEQLLWPQPDPLAILADRLDPKDPYADFWRSEARPEQLPPDWDWFIWLLLTGRGWGKTRTGAETTADFLWKHPGSRAALVAPTYADGRDQMVEGDSGLKPVLGDRLLAWNRSIGEIRLTNSSYAKLYSSEEPDSLRGPNNAWAWCDELASWTVVTPTWDMLMMTLRAGRSPRCIVTTTPRPLPLVRELISRARFLTSRAIGSMVPLAPTSGEEDPQGGDAPTQELDVHLTRGRTYENEPNLARRFISTVIKPYEGTRLGRQEIEAEVLEDVPGAAWKTELIDRNRVTRIPLVRVQVPNSNSNNPNAPESWRTVPGFKRFGVAIDPAVTATDRSDETGIIGGGITPDDHCYIVLDSSGRFSPNGWATEALAVYDKWQADFMVAEINNGGDMVGNTLRTLRPSVHVHTVHATRGKLRRAEPIVGLYERGLVHHVGVFPKLEAQMTTWTKEKEQEFSPDRMDALIWLLTKLFEVEGDVELVPEFLGVA